MYQNIGPILIFSGSFELDKTKDSVGREFRKHFGEIIKNEINLCTLNNVIKGRFTSNTQKNTIKIATQFNT